MTFFFDGNFTAAFIGVGPPDLRLVLSQLRNGKWELRVRGK